MAIFLVIIGFMAIGGLYCWQRYTIKGNIHRLNKYIREGVWKTRHVNEILDAIQRLKDIGDSKAVEPLVRHLDNAIFSDLHIPLVEALAELGDMRAVEPLISFFGNAARPTDCSVDDAIVEALEKLGANKKQIGDAYIKAIENPEYYYTKQAARALEQMGDNRAIYPLIKKLGNESIKNISDIVVILEKLGATKEQITEEYIKELGEHSITDDVIENWRAVWRRYKAVWILGEYGDKRAIEPLIRLSRYAEYMEYNCNRYDNEELDEFTHAKEALVKLAATKEQIGDACLNAVENPIYVIRLRAFDSLIDLCDRRAIEPLMQLELESNFFGNPHNFFDTLEKLGAAKEQITEVAIKGLTSTDKWDRLASIEKLVKLGDKRSVNQITQLIADNDEDVRSKAANALKYLNPDFPGKP